jgi:hypothetical protein
MQGILWEGGPVDFIVVTAFLGGGAAYLTGRAVALTWRPVGYLLTYLFLLSAAVRFIHFALFEGTLLSLQFYLVDVVVLLCFGGLGYQLTRARQMAGQYAWLYERSGPLSWRPRRSPQD